MNRVRIARGLVPTPYEILRPVASAGARGLIGAAFGMTAEDEGYDALRVAFLDAYEAAIADNTTLFDGVAQLLETLESLDLAWGIVTNKASRFTDRLVPKIGLSHAGCVISGDTTPHSKPHPEPLFEAARRLSLSPSECWYVGDDLRDIQAGKAAGMMTVAAAWGYCGHAEPATWDAHALAPTPLDVMQLLRNAG